MEDKAVLGIYCIVVVVVVVVVLLLLLLLRGPLMQFAKEVQ